MRHLLIKCPFTKQIWYDALAWLRLSCRTPQGTDESIFTWLSSANLATPKHLRKGLGSTALLMPWML
jgi:hypothetical protein